MDTHLLPMFYALHTCFHILGGFTQRLGGISDFFCMQVKSDYGSFLRYSRNAFVLRRVIF